MKFKKLKDDRWQVRRDDGVCFSLTAQQWREAAREVRELERAMRVVQRLKENA